MSTDYNALRDEVAAVLKDEGAPGVVRRSSSGTGKPWNPGSGSPSEYNVSVIIIDYDIREIDGSNIRRTDQKALISADTLDDLSTNDQLIFGGKIFTILNPQPLAPIGLTVMYQAQVRR